MHFNIVFLKKGEKVLGDKKKTLKNCFRWRNCAEVVFVAVVWVLEEEGCGPIRCVTAVGAGRQTLLAQDSGAKSQRWHCPLPGANRRLPCRFRAATSHKIRCYSDLIKIVFKNTKCLIQRLCR